jgi:hypothetical protein
MRLELPVNPAARALPTDERLARMKGGAADDDLLALYFQYGRYLLIASSRPGSMAANLQGKWNDSLTPAWGSKYTININTEMNYWPAETCNLSELHDPLFDLIEKGREDGRRVAKFYYGSGGFVLHHNTDLWGDAVPIDGARWGIWPMGAAWLSLHLADHYDFTRDRKFLAERAYPVMKEAASESGSYTIPALQTGAYRLEFEAPGFKKGVRTQVELAAGATLRQDIVLELGSVAESVMVEAKASPVESETTRVATTIENKLVQDMPLFVNGSIRSVVSLALLAPETKTVGGNLKIGGGQVSGWEMMMDGQPLSSASSSYQDARAPLASVPIDAIGEFTVESNGMKAEFGRATGAVTFTTKSGTNSLHGNLFDEMRNNAMDARGFFASQTPILKQHDFGATGGGPIYLPKIYNGRNRTFFFATYQGFRNRAGRNPSYLTIPTPANLTGDFSGWTRSGVMARSTILPAPPRIQTAPATSGRCSRATGSRRTGSAPWRHAS